MTRFFTLIFTFIFLMQANFSLAGFGSVSISDEIKMGREFEVIVKSQLPIIEDPEVKNYVQSIVDNLLKQVSAQPYTFKVNVLLSNALNAFAAPGGFIMVYSGLLQRLEHESELVGILAHEISHITERHISKQMERNSKINILSIAGAIAAMALGGGGRSSEALMAGSLAAGQTAMLKYSRLDESECDYLGLNMMTKAGYNPNGLIGAFEKMQVKQWQSTGSIPSYMSTHPDLSLRLTDLKSRVQSLDPKLLQIPENDTKFLRVQTIIWAKYVEAKQAELYFNNKAADVLSILGLGITKARLNKIAEASQSFSQALELAPKDPLVLREAGIFNFDKGDLALAEEQLKQALRIDPKDYMAQFYLARLYDTKKDYAQAEDLFQTVLRYVPEDSQVHSYYARSLGNAGKNFEAYLHLAYANLYRYDEKKIDSWFKKAESEAKSDKQKKDLERFQTIYTERKAVIKQA